MSPDSLLAFFPEPAQDLIQLAVNIGGLFAFFFAIWRGVYKWVVPLWRNSLWCRRTRLSRAELSTDLRPDALSDLRKIPLGDSEFVLQLQAKEPIVVDQMSLRFVAEDTDREGVAPAPTEKIRITHVELLGLPGNPHPSHYKDKDRTGGGWYFMFEPDPYTVRVTRSTVLLVKVHVDGHWEGGGYLGIRFEHAQRKRPIFKWLPAGTEINATETPDAKAE